MSTDEYVPDEQALEVAWIEFEGSADDINVASAEFQRGLARVRRDAAREALDALAAAEHRATRAEAQSAIRGRAVAIHRERTREAEAERDASRKQYDEDIAYWIAATDAAEARIKAVRDVLAHHPYGGPDQEDAIRRALDA